MTLYRLASLNLIYKIKEIMENNGFANYDVIEGYPNVLDENTAFTWPTIAIELDQFFGRDVEIGSNQWGGAKFTVDIFANTDSQRDDVSYIIWHSLNENYSILYDFNSGFPTVVGDYSGISTIGDWYTDKLTIFRIPPVVNSQVIGEKHHGLIDGVLLLPST